MSLQLDFKVVPDPQGFAPELLLHGDWLFVTISDGTHTGLGEATHNGDDAQCMKTIAELFDQRIKDRRPTLSSIRDFEDASLATTHAFMTATALSAINQALYDLLARQNAVPVWRLFTDRPLQRHLPLYTTINRSLTSRTLQDYRHVLSLAVERGFRHVKCAPFESVRPGCDQIAASAHGLSLLSTLKSEFPQLTFRVDCHKRFTPETFMKLLPEFNRLALDWIEEPFEIGEHYVDLRRRSSCKVAAGELCFGPGPFEPLLRGGWVDVIMPDVKHVGGFGPLINVCALAAEQGVAVSPHNPSGPISTAASSHSAALYANVTSLEIPFDRDRRRTEYHENIDNGCILITDKPGWGIDLLP